MENKEKIKAFWLKELQNWENRLLKAEAIYKDKRTIKIIARQRKAINKEVLALLNTNTSEGANV
jgi:hypothetical protein